MASTSKPIAMVPKAGPAMRPLALVAVALLALSVCCTAEADAIPLRCNELVGFRGFLNRVLSSLHLSPFRSDGCDLKADTGTLQIRAWCIPATAQLLEDHEGRHKCAYQDEEGHRAVGVGYRLDDDADTRKKELGTLLADYQKVYEGEACLNEFQINALLALDTKRSLDQAAEAVKAIDQFCCELMAVFGDIVHASGAEVLKSSDFQPFIEKVSAKQWDDAAEEFLDTEWCDDHYKRCQDDAERIRKGCSSSSFSSYQAEK